MNRSFLRAIYGLLIIALLMSTISINFSTKAYASVSSDGIHEVYTSGEFRLPASVEFNSPGAVAIDSKGNVYVADTSNHRILKLDSKGTYLTQWGGLGSSKGKFNYAQGIAVDKSDNVYVTDMLNNRIQKFDSRGTYLAQIGTAGTGKGQFSRPAGITLDSKGNLYVVDSGNHRVQKLDTDGSWTVWGKETNSVPASGNGNGEFYFPTGIIVDEINESVYVADTSNHRIQKLSSNSWTVIGSKGTTDGKFDSPSGVALDSEGNLYVVEKKNHRIQKLDTLGNWTVFAGKTSEKEAPIKGGELGQFSDPGGIAVDSKDNVYVADTFNHRIQRLDSKDSSWISWGKYGAATINSESSTVVSDGNVYVADKSKNQILKFDTSGNVLDQWGSKGNAVGQFSSPEGIAVDSSSNIYVADTGNKRIQKRNPEGTWVVWGNMGSGNGTLSKPSGIALDSKGDVYVTDKSNNQVVKFDSNGTYVTKWGSMGKGIGQFTNPIGIAVDRNGNVYVVDSGNHRIQKFDSNGGSGTAWGKTTSKGLPEAGTSNGQFYNPTGIATDHANNIYVADYDNNRIQVLDSSGTYLTQWGSGDDGDVRFFVPNAITVDNSGELYVIDASGKTVRKFIFNNNTMVSELTISDGMLNPSFTSSYTGPYEASVAASVYELKVTPTLLDPMATVNVTVESGKSVSSSVYNNVASYNVPLDTGSNLISVTVTASDRVTKKSYTIDVTRISNNALLSDLAIEEGKGLLSPAFLPTEPNYSVDVSNTIENLHFSFSKADSKGTVTVTGAVYRSVTDTVYAYEATDLNIGPNQIQIVVTAQDGTVNPYNLTVNRAPAPSSNADLSDLILSSGVLSPEFASGTIAYTSSVANAVQSIAITANVSDSNAKMTVNGNAVISGQPYGDIGLNVGSNLITIVVTAQDNTTKTYLVTVDRASYPGTGSGSIPNEKVISTNGQLTLPTGTPGEVSLGDAIKLSIPSSVVDKELKLTIEKVLDSQKLLTNKEVLASPVYEILKNSSENFSKPVTLTLSFDPSSLKSNQSVGIFYYEEGKKEWKGVAGGEIIGNFITANVSHVGKFVVLVVDQATGIPILDKTTEPTTEPTTAPTIEPTIEVKLSDISGHWAEAAIKQAVISGFVKGYPDGTFKPSKTVTRAEFTVMLMNALKLQGAGPELIFTDTAKIGAWAQKAVAQAVQAGIIKGYNDGSFRPDAQITRAEMALIVAKALGQSIKAIASTSFADDKDIPVWAKDSVAVVKEAGIVQGKGNNEFAPQEHATRAEAITILLNMLAQMSK
ncbi:S-layer homology domain-containing protein [Cohnella abietis]|uniref:SLH domain-containing protein n=1 Tax=Cohnella abietis TaxID=2507935 RepID=A0A3T1DA67_9BACL|nr:S-layer homology domain-containing protein [Cohnella abietis]BBI34914.1 hypothetical protein KCTCHS21_43130 [Cohnella abietis]